MKFIATCPRFLFLVAVSSSLFFLRRRPICANSSSAALSFSLLRVVLSAIYHLQSCLVDARLLIWVMRRSIRRSQCTGLIPCLLIVLMDWERSQMRCFTSSSIRCVVKLPLSCQIPRVFAAHWLTPTPTFTAQIQTCRVGSWIVIASVTSDCSNQKASLYIFWSQPGSMNEWLIINASYSKQVLEVLNLSLRVMPCGSKGEEDVSKVLQIVS